MRADFWYAVPDVCVVLGRYTCVHVGGRLKNNSALTSAYNAISAAMCIKSAQSLASSCLAEKLTFFFFYCISLKGTLLCMPERIKIRTHSEKAAAGGDA